MSFRSALRRIACRSPQPVSVNEADYRALVAQSQDVICYVENGFFTWVSPSAATVFGWDTVAMVSQDVFSIVYEEDRPALAASVATLLAGTAASSSGQARVLCGDGSARWCETTATIERIADGRHRALLIIRDIAERKHIEQELSMLALQDGLTGLANRRAFDQSIEREWNRTLREGSEMALLLLDVDHFKQFNDRYGHQAGDDCLRIIAATVKNSVRGTDMACRYGGEEIAVILPTATSEVAIAQADRIRMGIAALHIPHEDSSCADHVTVSIGVASAFARVGGSLRMPESLLQAADHALYRAKAEGRDRISQSILIASSD